MAGTLVILLYSFNISRMKIFTVESDFLNNKFFCRLNLLNYQHNFSRNFSLTSKSVKNFTLEIGYKVYTQDGRIETGQIVL